MAKEEREISMDTCLRGSRRQAAAGTVPPRGKGICVVCKVPEEKPVGIISEYCFTYIFPFEGSKSMFAGGIIHLFLPSPSQHALKIFRIIELLQFHFNSKIILAKERFLQLDFFEAVMWKTKQRPVSSWTKWIFSVTSKCQFPARNGHVLGHPQCHSLMSSDYKIFNSAVSFLN